MWNTHHLYSCEIHTSLILCNSHQFEFRAIRTSLNFMQIRARPLITCKTYYPFFHEKDVQIQIPCDTHRYCIHVQYTLVFLSCAMQISPYSHAIHMSSLFILMPNLYCFVSFFKSYHVEVFS